MNFTRIFVVMQKEWAQVFRWRMTLVKIILIPMLITVGFVPLLSAIVHSHDESVLDATMLFLIALFPTLPISITNTISAGSIVGERTGRSLEPLLATPLTTAELLFGKMLAALIPALLEFWICYAVLVMGTHQIPELAHSLFNKTWLIAVLLVTPLLTILAVNLGLVISSRSTESGKAQESVRQLTTVLSILFIGGIVLARFKLKLNIDDALMWKHVAALAVLNIISFLLALRLFQRETIISRWE